jgi:mersacidin/lichenicidin family type 2 lantibiotic
MTKNQIVDAWKDTDYRGQLNTADRAALPAHPAGDSLLSDVDLESIMGGDSCHCQTLGCCPDGGLTSDPGACSWVCPTVWCSIGGGCITSSPYNCS